MGNIFVELFTDNSIVVKKILVIGAGRSTLSLISYLLNKAEEYDWFIEVCDLNVELAKKKIGSNKRAKATKADISDAITRVKLVSSCDIVISMLPAHMHIPIATDCIALQKHMVTASYISKEMQALNERAKEVGVVIMNEIGVDPGIDHLSAMKLIDGIRDAGGEIKIFESFTGGLVAPESEGDNPWKYKITWNPRNVVLAGSGSAVKFKQEGKYKYIPYHRLFRRTEIVDINGHGRFEGYANRDSLKYRHEYGLDDIPTIYRGTLRRLGFCRAWDVFVQLGMTDDSYVLENSEFMTNREFVNTFLPFNPHDSVELKMMHYLGIPHDSEIMYKLEWLGMFDGDAKTGLIKVTPAQILEEILKVKWALEPTDKDMIVMYHKVGYVLNGEKKMVESSMVSIGKDAEETAMARTVGLPVGMATKLILTGEINTPGVHIPISKEIYEPMLRELASHGIVFKEKEISYQGYERREAGS